MSIFYFPNQKQKTPPKHFNKHAKNFRDLNQIAFHKVKIHWKIVDDGDRSLNKRRSKSKEKNYLDMICGSRSLEERCKKTSQRATLSIGGQETGGLSEFSAKRKKDRTRWWSSRNRKQNPPFNAVDSQKQKQKQTAGNNSPNKITIYYIWKLEKRAHGSRLENSTVLIRLELSRPILAPHPIQLKDSKRQKPCQI